MVVQSTVEDSTGSHQLHWWSPLLLIISQRSSYYIGLHVYVDHHHLPHLDHDGDDHDRHGNDHENVHPDDRNKESGGTVFKPAVCMQLLKHATHQDDQDVADEHDDDQDVADDHDDERDDGVGLGLEPKLWNAQNAGIDLN